MYKYALKAENKGFKARADGLTAILFRAQKKWQESIERFEKSLQEFEALGARQWNVYWFAKMVIFEYARAYLERNEEGDKEKARNFLNQALEIFRKMGAKKEIEKIEAQLLQTETGKAASAFKPIGLVATGYADLDRLLQGGIPPNHAVVLTSPSCDERNLLIKTFLETGAKNGEATFYVTIDPGALKRLAEEFQSSFFLFVCNPQADAIVEDLPNVFKVKGLANLTEIGMVLTSAISKMDPSLKGLRRFCIDMISDILLQHNAVQTRRCLSALIPGLRSEGFTILAVMDPEMHSPQEVRAVLDLFEGEISIYEKQTEKSAGKFLKIKRMSDQEYLEDELLLTREGLKKQG
jgi:KaiC/GvpD/RAD55 family RecA-like ATPase